MCNTHTTYNIFFPGSNFISLLYTKQTFKHTWVIIIVNSILWCIDVWQTNNVNVEYNDGMGNGWNKKYHVERIQKLNNTTNKTITK